MRKNDEARLEIYEVEAMSDTVRKDFVYGFIAGIFIGTAGGFVINQVKKSKQLEKQNQPAEAKKPSVKEKVSAQTDALKANAQSQIQDIKDKAQQLKSDVKQKFNNDEQETDPKALRAQREAIRNEAAAHDLANVSPQAQDVQTDNNPLKSSQPDTVPFHEFTATGNALAAKEKAKLIENDNTVAAKVAELFEAKPVKSSGFKTVPVLVTVAAAATAAGSKKAADAKAAKPADAEKRTAQTHEKASFNKGVITHDKATANHSEAHKTPEASGKVESKTVNDTKTTKTETTKTTNTPKKNASTTKQTAKATSPKDATKTTKTTTQKPAAKGNKTTTQKTTTKTTKSAANKSTKKPSVTPANKKTTNNTTKTQPKGETTTKKIEKKTFND
ncbi:hypothetical protein [Staphylococcus simulans]|uniref:hypothetical protein n=1 Tax=Staphylococcus simulans TaxID=1286 RepID=UPI000D1EE44A|nr:hypothetical protein [Staphylococcus simulans]PTI86295.1 hypothetical protein BU053_08790 [Staphylococcus simulans]RIN47906.1 hypothetical protein BU041_12055 [Staphylococcus simulans]UXR53637.1 hypothetical protein MUA82_06055 [Staphylococcus simulans]